MGDREPVFPLRINITYDHDREMDLCDVGGGDYRLIVTVVEARGNSVEFFMLHSEPQGTLLLADLHTPDHENGPLSAPFQRRVEIVSNGKHCCAGRTRSGSLCTSIVKTAGVACRWHLDQMPPAGAGGVRMS